MTGVNRINPTRGGQANTAAHIRASIRMLIPTRKRKEARGILTAMIERIQLEEGCLSCRLYQDTRKGNTLLFEQIWADERCLEKHLRSEEFRNVLLVVEMASQPPEIRFDRIIRSTGIDAIEDVRKSADSLPGANGLPV